MCVTSSVCVFNLFDFLLEFVEFALLCLFLRLYISNRGNMNARVSMQARRMLGRVLAERYLVLAELFDLVHDVCKLALLCSDHLNKLCAANPT